MRKCSASRQRLPWLTKRLVSSRHPRRTGQRLPPSRAHKMATRLAFLQSSAFSRILGLYKLYCRLHILGSGYSSGIMIGSYDGMYNNNRMCQTASSPPKSAKASCGYPRVSCRMLSSACCLPVRPSMALPAIYSVQPDDPEQMCLARSIVVSGQVTTARRTPYN